MSDTIRAHCPLYLFTSTEPCWKCGTVQSVVGIATNSLVADGNVIGMSGDASELIFLTNIEAMPEEVFAYVSLQNPRYMKRYSRTADFVYYANTCECGANFGDHYLYSEPGGAFFPETEYEARRIRHKRMPFSGELAFECAYSQGVGEFILAHPGGDAAGPSE